MQYDSYFDKAGDVEQFWYRVTLLLIIFSPIAALVGPCFQLLWRNRPMRRRIHFVGVTMGVWLLAVSLLFIVGVPISDFVFD